MSSKASGKANVFSQLVNAELSLWIERRGLSLRGLQTETGISRSRLGKTINQDLAPLNLNELDTICTALDISPLDVIQAAERRLEER